MRWASSGRAGLPNDHCRWGGLWWFVCLGVCVLFAGRCLGSVAMCWLVRLLSGLCHGFLVFCGGCVFGCVVGSVSCSGGVLVDNLGCRLGYFVRCVASSEGCVGSDAVLFSVVRCSDGLGVVLSGSMDLLAVGGFAGFRVWAAL